MNITLKYAIQGIAIFTVFYGLIVLTVDLILIRTGV